MHRVATVKASLKVFFISQFGDVFFLLGLFFMVSFFESTSVATILSATSLINCVYLSFFSIQFSLTSVIGLTLTIALFLKSAQFFFFP